MKYLPDSLIYEIITKFGNSKGQNTLLPKKSYTNDELYIDDLFVSLISEILYQHTVSILIYHTHTNMTNFKYSITINHFYNDTP